MEKCGIAVIGAGASGLMAAVCLAEELRRRGNRERILLLDAAQKPGKKLLATGNGRCNITNRHISVRKYYGDVKTARPILEKYPAQAVLDKFSSLGLLCREEDEGRIYPYSAQASSVLDVLRFRLDALGTEIHCGSPVTAVKRQGKGFLLSCPNGQLYSDRVVLTAGGKASPQLGADGSGFAIARQLGHTVTPLFPSLVPVRTDPARVRSIKGMRSRGTVRLIVNGKTWQKEQGEIQFTENGLSGICVFQLSRAVSGLAARNGGKIPPGVAEISIDLMPEYSEKDLTEEILRRRGLFSDLPAQELLTGLVNKRVGQEIIKLTAGRDLPDLAGKIPEKLCGRIAAAVKDFSFPCLGVMPWQNAQVTAGGIPLTEINPDTMQSRLCRGLYFAGEILNLDGPCGGYNLHWAWASAMAIRIE